MFSREVKKEWKKQKGKKRREGKNMVKR